MTVNKTILKLINTIHNFIAEGDYDQTQVNESLLQILNEIEPEYYSRLFRSLPHLDHKYYRLLHPIMTEIFKDKNFVLTIKKKHPNRVINISRREFDLCVKYTLSLNHLILEYTPSANRIKTLLNNDVDDKDNTLLHSLFLNNYLTINEKISMLHFLKKRGMKCDVTFRNITNYILYFDYANRKDELTDYPNYNDDDDDDDDDEEDEEEPDDYEDVEKETDPESLSIMTNKVRLLSACILCFGFHSSDGAWIEDINYIFGELHRKKSPVNPLVVEHDLLYLMEQFTNPNEVIHRQHEVLLLLMSSIDSPALFQYMFENGTDINNTDMKNINEALREYCLESVIIFYKYYQIQMGKNLTKEMVDMTECNPDERVYRWATDQFREEKNMLLKE